MGNELVSIIIPVYNRAGIVGRTLQSVAAQSYRPLELILVDNNSTDNTLEALNGFKSRHESPDFRIIVMQESRQGAAAARNKGGHAATGKWLIFFDSDDAMDPSLVEKFIVAANDTDMVIARADITNLDGIKTEKPFYTKDLLVNHLFHSCTSPSQCMIKKESCESAGWWNEALLGWDDWEFSMRLLLKNPKTSFMTDPPLIHVFLQRISITGTNFASKHGSWELAIDSVEQDIKELADTCIKERLLKYVEFRRMTLSGLYIAEGRRDLAAPLYEKAYARMRHDKTARWLYPLLRSYIAAGGRGASHIVKLLVK